MYNLDNPIKLNKSFQIDNMVEKAVDADGNIVSYIEASDDAVRFIEVSGWASRMYNVAGDYVIDADRENINTFGIGLTRLANGNLPLLFNHDQNKAVGKVLTAEYRNDGLYVTARLFKLPDDDLTNYTYEAVKAGIITSFSVGILVEGFDVIEQDNEEYLQLTKSEMIELSLVPVPANQEATFRITQVKNAGLGTVIDKSALKKENADICNGFECAIQKTLKGHEDMQIDADKEKHVTKSTEEEPTAIEAEEKTEVEEGTVESTADNKPQEETSKDGQEETTEETNKPDDEPAEESVDEQVEEKEVEPKEETQSEDTTSKSETADEKVEEEVQKTPIELVEELAPSINIENLDDEALERLYEVVITLSEKIEQRVVSTVAEAMLADA